MGGYTNNQLHVREAHTTFSYLIFDGAERVATVDETRERLAHLFAAAPELLENLIGCVEALASYAPDCIEVQCARAAISRATGEGE